VAERSRPVTRRTAAWYASRANACAGGPARAPTMVSTRRNAMRPEPRPWGRNLGRQTLAALQSFSEHTCRCAVRGFVPRTRLEEVRSQRQPQAGYP
jgi:hypothetical protein